MITPNWSMGGINSGLPILTGSSSGSLTPGSGSKVAFSLFSVAPNSVGVFSLGT